MNRKITNPIILVSGAGGFLGKEIISQLIEERQAKVIALSSKKEILLNEFGSFEDFTAVDMKNWGNELKSIGKIDFLINCAFPRVGDPEQLAEGISFTEQFIKKALDLQIKNIINISSQSVYSQKSMFPADEKTAVVPESLYGMAKYSCEKIVSSLCEITEKSVVYSHIRLGSLCGIDLEARMTNRFVKNALEKKIITINGGSQQISYLDVRDAAAAITAMIKLDPGLWKPVYNLGNRHSFTILELAETVKTHAENYSVETPQMELQEGQNQFSNLIVSAAFYRDFGWHPHYTMPMIVEELFEHYTGRMIKEGAHANPGHR